MKIKGCSCLIEAGISKGRPSKGLESYLRKLLPNVSNIYTSVAYGKGKRVYSKRGL